MADLGKVVVTDGGTYSASVTYEKLTFVHYNGDAYLTLKTVKGVTPTDDGTNYRLFCKSAVTATTSKAGIVMPDGFTISISNGKISAKKATQSAVGVVKGSDDINVDSNGAITVNTEFTQATALANLIAGEAIKVVLGKVSKAIATTMNLDQNALLKNMVSGIDANDGNKIPSSAFVHTLYERLGMGTDLSAGDAKNVTQAVNSLYSNFFNRIDVAKISLLTQPSGTTIRQKIENCQKGTLYSWAHNPSELYNPTGKNGTWSFLIARVDKEMYTICLACEGGSKLYIYSYNANAWYGMDGTIVRQFN